MWLIQLRDIIMLELSTARVNLAQMSSLKIWTIAAEKISKLSRFRMPSRLPLLSCHFGSSWSGQSVPIVFTCHIAVITCSSVTLGGRTHSTEIQQLVWSADSAGRRWNLLVLAGFTYCLCYFTFFGENKVSPSSTLCIWVLLHQPPWHKYIAQNNNQDSEWMGGWGNLNWHDIMLLFRFVNCC